MEGVLSEGFVRGGFVSAPADVMGTPVPNHGVLYTYTQVL